MRWVSVTVLVLVLLSSLAVSAEIRVKTTPQGEASVLASLPGKNNGHVVYSNGVLYAVDRGGHRIYKVEMNGEFEVLAGSGEKGGAEGAAADASDDGKTLYVNDVADESSTGMVLGPTRIRRSRWSDGLPCITP